MTSPEQQDQRDVLTKDGLSIAINNYNYIEQQVTLAAAKSALLVAAHAILAAAYISVTKDYHVFQTFPGTFWAYVYGAAGVAIALAFLLSLWAIIPNSRVYNRIDLLFFASIASRSSAEDYCKEFFAQDQQGFDKMLLKTIHGKSIWLRKKFALVRVAIYSSFAGTILAIVSLFKMSSGLSAGC